MTDPTLEKARAHAYRLIKYRVRSQKELQKRLREKGYSQEIIARLVSEFREEGLLDDVKFARLWAKMRSQASPRGLSLIKAELLSKEVDSEITDETIEELKQDYDEEEAARELLRRRLRSVAGLDKMKAKARLFAYLKRRGFANGIIYKLLSEIY